MSDTSSAIFVPSHSLSPTNNRTGSTPYVIASPPPDSPTDSKAAWPYQQMIEHVAHLLNVGKDKVHCQFPTNHSLLPINCSPPCASSPIFVPPTPSPPFIPRLPTGPYPGTKLAEYINPNFPSEPPSSPKPLPIPTLHDQSTFVVWSEGPTYENKEEYKRRTVQGSPMCIPLTDITCGSS